MINRLFKDRICHRCDEVYSPTGSSQKYCGDPSNKGSCSYKQKIISTILCTRRHRREFRDEFIKYSRNYYQINKHLWPEYNKKGRARRKLNNSLQTKEVIQYGRS